MSAFEGGAPGALGDALGGVSASIERVRSAEWRVSPRDGAGDVRAVLVDGWLLLEQALGGSPAEKRAVPPSAPSPAATWQLLCWSGGIPGGVKLALVERTPLPSLCLRAELPLAGSAELEPRIAGALAGFARARAEGLAPWGGEILGDGRNGDFENEPATDLEPGDGEAGTLAELCREAGWPFVERSARRLAVDLGVKDAFRQAIVNQRADGGVVAAVDLATDAEDAPDPCAAALGTHLLRTAGRVRMVRAAGGDGGGRPSARFEVAFPRSTALPSPGELAHALAALAVACRTGAREAELLSRNELLATRYLALQPWWAGAELGPNALASTSRERGGATWELQRR